MNIMHTLLAASAIPNSVEQQLLLTNYTRSSYMINVEGPMENIILSKPSQRGTLIQGLHSLFFLSTILAHSWPRHIRPSLWLWLIAHAAPSAVHSTLLSNLQTSPPSATV
jgi:hypothetical protein